MSCDGLSRTFQLSRALGLPFLAAIPRVLIFIALAAWVATFFGLLTRLAHATRELRSSRLAARPSD
jgi:hypothetical protein